jgi:acyl-CoA synthetase (NDP forming)
MTEAEARRLLAESDRDIARILAPQRGVAFVGSARMTPALQLQMSRYGDARRYIVNPKGGEADGVPVFPSVLDLPDDADLVVVKVSPEATAKVIADCGRRGIRQALVFTDGYTEVGPRGAEMERELAEVARRGGVRIIGPNTNDNAFERYPVPANHRGGKIAMVTQSGANGRSVVEGVAMGACFHRWVTTGNEVDLEVADFIHHFAGLDEVAVIALYVEGFKSPEKLRVALDRAIRAGKPVVAIKMGVTERGAKAAASHTGHLTGADAVVNGLFRQYGVIRVGDVDELLEFANLFSKLPLDAGVRCAAYTISGGTAALMAEHAALNDVPMPENTAALQAEIHAYVPTNVSVANPIDNGGVFVMTNGPEIRRRVIDLAASNPEVDLLIFGMNAAYGPLSDRMAEDMLAWAPTGPKPVLGVWTSIITDTQGYADLVASGAPFFRSFGKCMRALGARQRYIAKQAGYTREIRAVPPLSAASRAALGRSGPLEAAAAARLLIEAGIPLAREILAASAEAAARAAAEIGFPVVLKLMSRAIPHKTDLGLVRLGVDSEDQARAVAAELLARAAQLAPGAAIDGILVQEQVAAGVEMIIGLTQDPQFGPALTIGAGGVHAEVLKDAATAPLPVTADDVREMIAGLRAAPLLKGVRGAPPADLEALVRLACAVGDLGIACGPALAELDLNPVVALADRAVAVDALVIAAGAAGKAQPRDDRTRVHAVGGGGREQP